LFYEILNVTRLNGQVLIHGYLVRQAVRCLYAYMYLTDVTLLYVVIELNVPMTKILLAETN
jgi:hypothetical protein